MSNLLEQNQNFEGHDQFILDNFQSKMLSQDLKQEDNRDSIEVNSSFQIYPIKIRYNAKNGKQVKGQFRQMKKIYTRLSKISNQLYPPYVQINLKCYKSSYLSCTNSYKLNQFEVLTQQHSKSMSSKLKIGGVKINKQKLAQLKLSSLQGVEVVEFSNPNDRNTSSINDESFLYLIKQLSRYYNMKAIILNFISLSNCNWLKQGSFNLFLKTIQKFQKLQKIVLRLQNIIVCQFHADFIFKDLLQSMPRLQSFFLEYGIDYKNVISNSIEGYDNYFSQYKQLEELSIKGPLRDVSLLQKLYDDVKKMPQLTLLELAIELEQTYSNFNLIEDSQNCKHVEYSLNEVMSQQQQESKHITLNENTKESFTLEDLLSTWPKIKKIQLQLPIVNKFISSTNTSNNPLEFIETFQLNLKYKPLNDSHLKEGISQMKNLRNLCLQFYIDRDCNQYEKYWETLNQLTNLENFSIKNSQYSSWISDHFTVSLMKNLSEIKTLQSIKLDIQAKIEITCKTFYSMTYYLRNQKLLKNFQISYKNYDAEQSQVELDVFEHLSLTLCSCDKLENVEIRIENLIAKYGNFRLRKQFSNLKVKNQHILF